MQQNLLINTQHAQTFKTDVKFIKITSNYEYPPHITSSRSSFSLYAISCQYPIHLKCNNERNFINQLIISLQESAHFEYSVHLTSASTLLSAVAKTTPKMPCSHFIMYCSIVKIDEIQEERMKVENDFRQKCARMNSILCVLKQKFKMETKISFWVRRFNDFLKQFESKQIKQKYQLLKKQQSLFDPDGANSRMVKNVNQEKYIKI